MGLLAFGCVKPTTTESGLAAVDRGQKDECCDEVKAPVAMAARAEAASDQPDAASDQPDARVRELALGGRRGHQVLGRQRR